MSTSQHAFNQVKSILGKLERDIDDARQRRLRATGTDVPDAMPTRTNSTESSESLNPDLPPSTGQSGYGMARPLRKSDE